MARTKPWELSDTVWKRAEPLLPPPISHPKGEIVTRYQMLAVSCQKNRKT